MQRTATTNIGLGLAGALTVSLAFAPSAFANEAPTPVDETPVEKVLAEKTTEQAPFLDLMYASPYKDLKPGDTTTVVIAQTVPASYTLVSYMSNGAKCFAPYDAPAADHTKSGTEADADLVVRSIVSTGVDANDDGIDDWYAGTYDENGTVACKIKVTDEFGNLDWKYIYISVGLPKETTIMPVDTTVKTPTGDDFDGGATTTVAAPAPTTAAPVATTAVPVKVADVTVAPTNTVAAATLPRTGTATWVEALIGTTLAAAGAAMLTFSRRRAQAAEVRSNG